MSGLIDQWQSHIYRIKVPVPFPLRWINSYAVRGDAGWSVIDPGLRTEQAIEVWTLFFQQTGSSLKDVDQIILTHHHPDHIGLAGWMQLHSGAPVQLHPLGAQQAENLWGAGRLAMEQRTLRLFAEHGLDQARIKKMQHHMEQFVLQVRPLPVTIPLNEGDVLRLGDQSYEAIATPGHALGHISLYDKSNRTIFCGDHVLPRITPNVSYLPGVDENPLASYLHSLRNMLEYPVDFALPGHRDPFHAYHGRITEILQHHEERLSELHEWINHPASAMELCDRMFGDRLSIHQLRFALSEILAHLIFLQNEGKARQQKNGDTVLWHAV